MTDDDDDDVVDRLCRGVIVPSCWTLDGAAQAFSGVIDPPMYTNVQMPFDTLYPHVPRVNPAGVYRLVFDALPRSWAESDDGGGIGCGGARVREDDLISDLCHVAQLLPSHLPQPHPQYRV